MSVWMNVLMHVCLCMCCALVAYSNTGMNEPADAQIKEWMRQELRGVCVGEGGVARERARDRKGGRREDERQRERAHRGKMSQRNRDSARTRTNKIDTEIERETKIARDRNRAQARRLETEWGIERRGSRRASGWG